MFNKLLKHPHPLSSLSSFSSLSLQSSLTINAVIKASTVYASVAIKNVASKTGVKLSGTETKDQLKGIIKGAIATQNK